MKSLLVKLVLASVLSVSVLSEKAVHPYALSTPSLNGLNLIKAKIALASKATKTMNEDGSSTITTENDDGSVTTATSGFDGSTVKTVYPDGSSKEVTTNSEGQVVTKKNKDGSWSSVETNW